MRRRRGRSGINFGWIDYSGFKEFSHVPTTCPHHLSPPLHEQARASFLFCSPPSLSLPEVTPPRHPAMSDRDLQAAIYASLQSAQPARTTAAAAPTRRAPTTTITNTTRQSHSSLWPARQQSNPTNAGGARSRAPPLRPQPAKPRPAAHNQSYGRKNALERAGLRPQQNQHKGDYYGAEPPRQTPRQGSHQKAQHTTSGVRAAVWGAIAEETATAYAAAEAKSVAAAADARNAARAAAASAARAARSAAAAPRPAPQDGHA